MFYFEHPWTTNVRDNAPCDITWQQEPIPCLVREFFENERRTKPAHLRAKSCMISCPCPLCNPVSMRS